MITLNRNIKTKQNYITQILTALLFILKLTIFRKKLLIMFKNGLTHLTMMKVIKDRSEQVKKKVIGLFKDELEGKMMLEFVGPRGKTYAQLMNDDSEHEKAKGTKRCVTKRRLMFKSYKKIASLMIKPY